MPLLPDEDSHLAREWFSLANELTRSTTGFTPPVASRAYAYMGVTLYESLVGGMPDHISLAGQLNGLPVMPAPSNDEYDWPTVANTALASMAQSMYGGFTVETSTNVAAIDALEAELGAEMTAAPDVAKRSVDYGQAVADAIHLWSRGDGGDRGFSRNFPTTFFAASGPGLWEPTEPTFQNAMLPTWGKNRPFLSASVTACDPPAPPAYSEDPSSPAYEEAFEVYTTVAQADAEQRAIAAFWSDDPFATATPPGHSMSIATQALAQTESTLATAAEVYARLGIAVADAFIATWRVKFQYIYLRPITYVHDRIDESWTPLLITPPFPEYPSGHSVQSGAAAEVLTHVLGTLAFEDRTQDALGLPPRSFSSFHEAAQEAAMSRLYGGIHFRSAIELGLLQGYCIGERVNALRFRAP
jgi:membrane-associated phospholipid phosphatase